ncbi:Helicase associated domain protein [Sphaerisporangium sp. NPDC005289]|uniref:DEAD/DEAH box helicase n=1 Tax=Sphaerisporangium sp. NPDC005289 TaxID=3155247 RepID=UPI0033A5BC38
MVMDTTGDRWAYQTEAVNALSRALGSGGRATLEMACGTGKSAVAAKTVDQLAPFGRALIAVPNLELITQMVATFQRHGLTDLGQVIGVCSSSEIRYLPRGAGGLSAHARVTTTAAELAAWSVVSRRVTVLTTYHSLPVIAAAHANHGLPAWDLLIADEAHRTAGRAGGPWTQIHDDVAVPAARRLYMTATRRIHEGRTDTPAVSMDDEKVFGPVAYRLSFSEAYQRGLVADYQIVAATVTDTDIKALTDDPDVRLKLARAAISPHVLATQITVLRAAAEYGVRRAITFHNRVADARGWAQTIHQAWNIMPPHHRPTAVSASFIHGDQDPKVRRAALQRLRDHSDNDPGELRVVCNARVLTEGVDAPAVDSVVIVDPRSSVVDIVQSVGRALRADRPGKIARIIVPVLMAPGDDPDVVVENSDFAKVWQVLRGMRAHDDRLAAELDTARVRLGGTHITQPEADSATLSPNARTSGTMPTWLALTGIPVPPGFAEAITLRAVTAGSSSWWEFYGAVKELHDRGHSLDLPAGYVTESDLPLGQWLRNQRRHRASLPAERIDLLDQIGMVWDRKRHTRDKGLAAARAFAAGNNNSLHNIPKSYIHDGVRLSQWLTFQRQRHRAGTLPAQLRSALDAIDPTWHDGGHDSTVDWEAHFRDAQDHFTRHGHLRPQADHRTASGRDLSFWLNRQRYEHRVGRLSTERQTRLSEIGMVWSIFGGDFEQGLAAATAYAQQHGDLDVPSAWITEDDFRLGSWLHSRRHRATRLPAEQRQALEALDPHWASRRKKADTWNRYYAAAKTYVDQHQVLPSQVTRNHLPPPEGLDFRDWLRDQRQLARQGKLSRERRAKLEALDPAWCPEQTQQQLWDSKLQAAAAYVRQHGRLPFGRYVPRPEGDDFRTWLNSQRGLARAGSLQEHRRQALDALDPHWLDGPPKDPDPSSAAEHPERHPKAPS